MEEKREAFPFGNLRSRNKFRYSRLIIHLAPTPQDILIR